VPLTRNQIRGFWASWGGWTLDGMDSFIYALVLAPALTELLPKSGIPATAGNVGYYGGLLLAFFLVGWGLSMVWGPIADRFGRVRTLALTILCYSLFTFLGAATTNIWQLGACRLLAGIGIGGEWSMGGTFVAEEWPASRRTIAAGYLHTGYYVGVFLAALANYTIGAHYGWRAMFVVGGAPALFVAFVRYAVVEPARWADERRALGSRLTMRGAFAMLFSPRYRRRTLLNSTYIFVMGRIGVRTGVRHASRCGCRLFGARRRPARIERDDAPLDGHDSRLSSPATAGGTAGPTRDARAVLLRHVRDDRDRLWLRLLPGGRRDFLVSRVPVRARRWRSQLRGVHAVAAGTVRDELSR
jgi:MFS family permease